jgi:hypothetical protein
MITIGKANKFYTLWNINKVEMWSGPYRYYNVNYNFIKNVAMDKNKAIKKVEAVYGKKYILDETVRGSGSWIKNGWKKRQYVCNGPNTVIGFGKYSENTLQEVWDIDKEYITWLSETSNVDIASSITKCDFWIKHLQEQEVEKNKKSASINTIDYDDVIEVTFDGNLKIADNIAYYNHKIGDLILTLQFKHFKTYYYAGYEYGLPVITVGKKKSGKRIKNKTYKLKLKPLTFGDVQEVKVWNNDARKYEQKIMKYQDVEVVGMKLVK